MRDYDTGAGKGVAMLQRRARGAQFLAPAFFYTFNLIFRKRHNGQLLSEVPNTVIGVPRSAYELTRLKTSVGTLLIRT
jgi:hypothetical protein